MGTEAAWVPIVTAVISAGVNEANNRKTSRRQDQEAAEGIRRQSEIQRQATARLNQNLDTIEKSSPTEEKATLQDQFINAIRRNKGAGLGNLNQIGGVSNAAEGYASDASGQAIDYAGQLADMFSSVDAAGRQRRNEANSMGDLSMDFNRLGRDSSQEDFLTRMRVSRVRPNFGLTLLAQGISGAGQGYAASKNAGGGG